MQKDQLLELRNKIVQSTREIALKGEGSPAERLQVLMSIIRDGDADVEVLSGAFELAESMQGDEDKLTAMLDLLYEVDVKLGDIEKSVVNHDTSDVYQPEQSSNQ